MTRWARSIPPGLRLGLWLMILTVGGFIIWAASTNTNVFIVVPGRWEGNANNVFVFRAWLPADKRSDIYAGADATIYWLNLPNDQPATTKGTVVNIAAEPISSSTQERVYATELKLEGATPILVGLMGEAQITVGQKTILGVFWDWLRGTR